MLFFPQTGTGCWGKPASGLNPGEDEYRRIKHGFAMVAAAGDPEFKGRYPLDGGTRLAEARKRQRQEAREADHLRG